MTREILKHSLTLAVIAGLNFRYFRERLSEASDENRNLSTQKALHAWEMTVAIAAPFTPIPNPKMNTASRMILRAAPMSIGHIAMPGRPWILMNGFSPVVISTNIVPARYMERYSVAYPMVFPDAPVKNRIGFMNM